MSKLYAASKEQQYTMNYHDYTYLIHSDCFRVTGKSSNWKTILYTLWQQDGYSYCFWMRTCRFLYNHRWLKHPLYWLARYQLGRLKYRLGISIPFNTDIGSGFYIGHFGSIIVSPHARFGKNCNISQGTTVGKNNRGTNAGYPTIGDNVYIGPGAVISGNLCIGNNVAIGANCVVVSDVPDNAVVGGVPGKILSMNGSVGFVNKTNYPAR